MLLKLISSHLLLVEYCRLQSFRACQLRYPAHHRPQTPIEKLCFQFCQHVGLKFRSAGAPKHVLGPVQRDLRRNAGPETAAGLESLSGFQFPEL